MSEDIPFEEIIARILCDYPEAFENMYRTNAILLDLAPQSPRERILARSFIEIGGLQALQNAAAYPLEEKKLTDSLISTFAMERAAAFWVVRLFAVAMGLISAEKARGMNAMEQQKAQAISDGVNVKANFLQAQVSIGKKHVVALSADNTVFAGGDGTEFQCDTHGWRDIVAVAAGDAHTLGLRADGTVLATGTNAFDECDVGHLKNVKAIAAFGNDSFCVFADGTAQAFGRTRLDLSTYENITHVARYPDGLIGIRADGTIALVGSITDDEAAAEIAWLLSCHDVEQAISTYNSGCVILGRDKRIYKSNQPANYFAQWQNVIAIVDLSDCFAILRGDGTVRVLSYERDKPRPDTVVDKWRDIVAIFGGYKRLLGLDKHGNLHIAYTHQGWLWSNQGMKMDYVTSWYPVGVFD